MTYRFLPPAGREVREAARFYEEQASGLGFDFIAEVRAAIRRVLAHPKAWFLLGDATLPNMQVVPTTIQLPGSAHGS